MQSVTTTPDRITIDREFVPDCPVERLTVHPRNARDHDIESIKTGLTENPQYKPLVVQKSTGHILAGNGTFTVATTELGWTHIDAFFVDVDDAQALVILAADNKIGAESGYHEDALAALLSQIAEDQGGSLDGTGFDVDELEDLLSSLADAGDEALDGLPVSGPPPVLQEVPRTDAAYVETEEEEAARADKIGVQVPRSAQGLTEVVLVYGEDDKVEFGRNIAAARAVLGNDLRAPEIVQRALRVLLACLDSRHEAGAVDFATLLKAADVRDDE